LGKYYKSVKYKKVLALTKKAGFSLTKGSKHHKITSPTGAAAPLPKKHTYLSNGVVEDICNFLIEQGVDESLIDKYIK
jgi:hypothetical protein